jgi:hypothetical protein
LIIRLLLLIQFVPHSYVDKCSPCWLTLPDPDAPLLTV